MEKCSLAVTEAGKSWPEGIISVKLTMNPYLMAMAIEESLKVGMKLWEFINLALWEKLGKPDHRKLTDFAAKMEIFDEDPKWKKRLNMTARHELEMQRAHEAAAARESVSQSSADGNEGQPLS